MVSTPRRIVRSNRRVPSQIRTFGHAPNIMPMPNLLGMPKSSYDRFLSHSLRELFDEITPIEPTMEALLAKISSSAHANQ